MTKDKKKSSGLKEAYEKAVSILAEARNAHNAAAKMVKKAAQAIEAEGKA